LVKATQQHKITLLTDRENIGTSHKIILEWLRYDYTILNTI